MKAYEEEKELRVAAESSRAALAEELERVSHDAKRFSDQVSLTKEDIYMNHLNYLAKDFFFCFFFSNS